MQSKTSHSWMTAVPTACALTLISCALVSCGGGGGGSSSTSTPTPTPTPTPTTTVVTGVAADGAPLVAAQIRVVDGSGAAVTLQDTNGNTIPYALSNVADGSYKFVIPSGSPKMPLFIEAKATDATGTPVVLHSLLQSNTAPLVANITPLTDAVVAEILGGNPITVFQNASSNASAIANLGNATQITTASTQLKTIIAKNLTDAKAAASSTLDLFKDTSFITNKTGVDAALEALRIQIIPGAGTGGDDILQISNKFVSLATPEVTIDLATAKKQLGLGSTGTIASDITSTLKTTTSSTTTVTNFPSLDNLTIAINSLIAQRAPAASFAALLSAIPAPPTPALPSGKTAAYTFNGRVATDLENLLASYAGTNYQLSSMQVLGCIDDPIPSKGCTNFAIAAVVTDVNGNLVDVFRDGVAYNKTATPAWQLSGNGRYADIDIYPVAYGTFNFNGGLSSTSSAGTSVAGGVPGGSAVTNTTSSSATTPATANPGLGLQVTISDLDSSGNQMVGNSAVQLPSDQSVPFAFCGAATLCIWPNPAVLPTATGDLSDTLLEQPTLGWIGSVDAAIGAKFVVTYASWVTVTNQTANVYLPAGLPGNLGTSLFPMPDGISSTTPVTGANIVAGYNLSWATWAAANPNMKVFMVRTVVASTGAASLITDDPVPLGNATTVTLAPTTLPDGFTPTSYEIWIGAVDNLGHRYYTQLLGTN